MKDGKADHDPKKGIKCVSTDSVNSISKDACNDNVQYIESFAANLPGVVYRKCFKNNTFYFYNTQLELISGCSEESIDNDLLSPLFSYTVEEDVENIKTVIEQAIVKKELYKIKYRIRHKDGTIRYCHETGQPFYDGDRILYIDGLIFDETAPHMLHQKLVKSEHLVNSTIDSIKDFIHVIDIDYQILLFNAGFYTISHDLGFDDEVVGENLKDVFSFLPPKVFNEYDKVFTTGEEIVTYEDISIKERLFYTETRKIPVFHKGKVIRIVTIIRDLTNTRIAEKAFLESEERYKFLFNHMNDGLLLHELFKDGSFSNYIEVNAAACEQLGYTREELLLLSPLEVNTELSKVYFNKITEELIVKKRIVFKAKRKGKNSCVRDYEIDSHLFDHDDRRMVLSITRDVSEREEFLQEIIKAKEKAEESDRLKSAFLANMSHEIRTPMNGIIGFSEMLGKPTLTPEKRQYYARIVKDSSHQLLGLVNDILDISKIETGQIQIKKERVCINSLLIELYSFYKEKADEKNIELFTKLGFNNSSSEIVADKLKLKQIISNLLSNAIKFTKNGYIVVGYKLNGGFLEFFVQDTGIGIAKEYHQRIFERFRQADLELTRIYGGTGLGLAITKNLVELMGGSIKVDSIPEKGSTFSFCLPYDISFENDSTIVEEAYNVEIRKEELTILIAEDERVNFLYIEEVLVDENVALLHAHNGLEAVDLFQKNKNEIGLVLMDLKMPKMNGYDAIEKIRAIDSKVPIIAQTAFALWEDRERALKIGCVNYLAKPIKPSELRELVKKYMH